MQNINQRQDIVSRARFPKDELFRLVKTANGLTLDLNHSLLGRGLYVHKDEKSLDMIEKKNLLARYGAKDPSDLLIQMRKAL